MAAKVRGMVPNEMKNVNETETCIKQYKEMEASKLSLQAMSRLCFLCILTHFNQFQCSIFCETG